MNFVERLKNILLPKDVVVIGYYFFLTIIIFIFYNSIANALLLITLNFCLIFSVIWIANKAEITKNKILEIIHFYYVIPLIFITFKEIYFIISSVHTQDYDNLLIKIDRFIFGGDPTVFLNQFANPLLTEILQIAYATFFFLPIILGVEYHLKGEHNKFQFIIFSTVLGFFLSYIGYLLLPAIGPRFTLHSFEMTNTELPGLFLTDILREIVNWGESIPAGTPNPIEAVQRDVFPSGHTQMTLIIMYLSVKLNSRNKIFFLIDGSLLIFATVYLRYHYVTDLIGGMVFMILTMVLGKFIFNWWRKKQKKPILEY
ncbi:MAG: hypothetical protein CR986_07185 [Ignavibacteriae bacterium]|nr:MAG: hypothetical protein CR986_07185 [Ignavibacteriota bacterium]